MAKVVDNIVYGAPPEFDVLKEANSYGEYIFKRLKARGDEVSVVDGLTGEQVRASDIYSKVVRTAECLQAYGIKKGDRVGICSDTMIEYYYIVMGTMAVGAIICPVIISWTESDMNHAFNLSCPTIFFVSKIILERIAKLAKRNPYVKDIIVFDDDAPEKPFISFKDFLANPKIPSRPHFDCQPQDMETNVCAVLLTSGTTGLSKGVAISQYNLIHFMSLDTKSDKRGLFLCVAQYSNAFGFTALMRRTFNGTRVIHLPRYEEKAYLECVQKYKVNYISVHPPLMLSLAKKPEIDNYDLSSIERIYCSGTTVSVRILYAVAERLGVNYVRQFYGSSECLAVVAQSNEYSTKGSVGRLMPGIIGKVVHTETGAHLPANERGYLKFKANSTMYGYYNNPEASKVVKDEEGYVNTGDVGYYNERLEWFVVDRLKDIVMVEGVPVAPTEMETTLLLHPDIIDACVIGISDGKGGEVLFAFLTKTRDVTEKDVMAFVAEKMPYPKHLSGGCQFVEEIPKNPAGKMLRRILRGTL
uniref:Luciferin 4-monooxygenase n=1 Tax=Arachnocampa luminosa TaxID=270894 RepID=A0A346DKM3_9DIPT|nr:luciferase [Arachnocampa luminosa]